MASGTGRGRPRYRGAGALNNLEPMDKKKIVASVLVGLGALAYGISPIDFLPDVLGPLGLADDAAIITAAIVVITKWVSGAKRVNAADTVTGSVV